MRRFWAAGIIFALAARPAMGAVEPADLRCEYLNNPLCIDAARPRLSWILQSKERGQYQGAYQIRVASTESDLRTGRRLVWDSGKTLSSESLHIPYGGPPLQSGERYVWSVRVWDRSGGHSKVSRPASWEMGLLAPQDWRGQWIGATSDTAYRPAPLLRRTFLISGHVKRARAYVCGLGYYELSVNGRRIGDQQLDPGYTRYDRRALYAAHDVTRLLRQGRNALGVMLGTGWYNEHVKAVWYFDRAPWRAAPKLLLELRVEYADGRKETIVSDTDWRVSDGPVRFDSIYGGEQYDAQREKPGWDTPEYQDGAWNRAVAVASPGGRLAAQQMPPIRIDRRIKPIDVSEPKPGVFLFNMGQNFAGWAELRVKGPAGTRLNLRYGERLFPDGTLDTRDIGQHIAKTSPPQPFQTDQYTLKGSGEEVWHARFGYHGFQYVELTGWPAAMGRPSRDTLRGLFIHSAVEPLGDFECSNAMLNQIVKNAHWSYLSNLQSIPTDCPHREKNGWTGDAHLAAEQGLFTFDGAPVYTKWINDLGDEQRPTGELPGIVPSSGWGYEWGNGPAWDSAYLLIPWYLYVYCGDSDVLKAHYDGHKRYVDYLTAKSKDGINGLGLGDWAPWKTQTPVPVTSTGYYYRDARIVAKTAELLGKTEESRQYAALADSIRTAFNREFFSAQTGGYANDSQTANACAVYQGLAVDDRKASAMRRILASIDRNDGHIDTGILGAKYLLNALTENGQAEAAYRIVSQKTQPGWGWWISQGATTLWEQWNGTESRNHIMFGDVVAWMYKTLAGINPDPESPGFKRFIVKPYLVGDLTYAWGRYRSVRGEITSGWILSGDGSIKLIVTIPANTTATIFVPARNPADVREGDRPASTAPGLKFLRAEPGFAVYEAGSGNYSFESAKP